MRAKPARNRPDQPGNAKTTELEMIMSTAIEIAARDNVPAPGVLAAAGAAIGGWWARHCARRKQNRAIEQLSAMSDRELRDIGVARAEIEGAVRGVRERDRLLLSAF
jgi:uncharacterized protein YjiS (DUF1127 family)